MTAMTAQPIPTISAELMLLRWAESSNGGASITFLLSDAADLEPFKAMTVGKGNKGGQRFMAVLAQLGDDERPVPVVVGQPADQPADQPAVGGAATHGEFGGHAAAAPLKGGPLSKLAGRWCADPRFQQWIRRVHGAVVVAEWGETEAAAMAPAEFARQAILLVCSIDSRAELDHDEAAEDEFHDQIRAPFAAHLAATA